MQIESTNMECIHRFKRIARLKKLQDHMVELSEVQSKLRPYKKYQFWILLFAEMIALFCILIPSSFEISGHNSIRATVELRDFQVRKV
jgi:hypothetical protein